MHEIFRAMEIGTTFEAHDKEWIIIGTVKDGWFQVVEKGVDMPAQVFVVERPIKQDGKAALDGKG